MFDGIDETETIAAVERVLLEHGPLKIEDLAQAMEAAFPELVAQMLAERPGVDLLGRLTLLTRRADAFWGISGGRIAPVLHHLRRATFTHRLSPAEAEREAIDLNPDFVALALPASFNLADGTPVHTAGSNDEDRAAEYGSILGPGGWLAPFAAGDLLALRYDGEHAHLEQLAPTDIDGAVETTLTERLRHTFDALVGARAPEVHRLVVDTMGEHPDSFAMPVAPLSELLASTGIRVREAWVGPAERAWPTPPEQARRHRMDELLRQADGCCQRAAHRALDGWHTWMETRFDQRGAPAAHGPAEHIEHIEHGPVAALLAEVATLGRPLTTMRRLGEWASEIAAEAGTITPGLQYLRALGAEAGGDPLAAEAHLQSGLEVAADHPACLGFLAELAAERGDATRSVNLLRRAGRSPGPNAMLELDPFLISGKVGRNELCPCGSGRKFKTCCAVRPALRPLPLRSAWLLSRATRHALRADPFTAHSLQQLFENSGGEQTMALVADMLLFVSPGLTRYLTNRGALLLLDELATARSWLDQPLRLLEIDAKAPGGSMEVIDQRSGERLTILDGSAAAPLDEHETFLARVLPVDDENILSHALLEVPTGGRARALTMLEGDVGPIQLLELLIELQVDAIGAFDAGIDPESSSR